MKNKKIISQPVISEDFDTSLKKYKEQRYQLKLYVTGMTPQSINAIDNLRVICEEHLKGRYDLEVIDLYKNPSLAKGEQIIAAPTLIKKLPLATAPHYWQHVKHRPCAGGSRFKGVKEGNFECF